MKLSPRTHATPIHPVRWAAAFTALTLLAGACGGEGGGDGAADGKTARSEEGAPLERGLEEAGKPQRGGRIVYGVEAETAGGWCLPEAQLAPSGNLIRAALYDSLTAVNSDGEAKPYLAESVTPADNNSTWTLEIREGVTFHDDTELDATVVKNNIDAYLGRYPARAPTLFPIVMANMDTVTVTGPMTIVITTKVPWVALPTYLAMISVMGQSQLDDPESCDSNMVGTGPFELSKWTPDQELIAQKNPKYWQIAPDGQPYPYADAIAFRPIVDTQQRINAIEAGEVNVMAISDPNDIHGSLAEMHDDEMINLITSADHAEVEYLMLNSSKPPFDDERMRRALAQGIDRVAYNELTSGGFPTIADQPFPEGDMGYLDDPGFPEYDQAAAKALVAEYMADGNEAAFTISAAAEPALLARAQVLQQQLGKIDIKVNVRSVDEATLINEAIAGTYQANVWAQHAGGDPDAQYLWWKGAPNPTNFARIEDPVLDQLLIAGRSEPDPVTRRKLYESISERFAKKVWNIWTSYAEWGIALSPKVHGVFSADLPDDGGDVFTGLAGGHPTHAMWIESD